MPSFDFSSPQALDEKIQTLIKSVTEDTTKPASKSDLAEIAVIEAMRKEIKAITSLKFNADKLLTETNAKIEAIDAKLKTDGAATALTEAQAKEVAKLNSMRTMLVTRKESLQVNQVRAPLTNLDISKRVTGLLLAIHNKLEINWRYARDLEQAKKSPLHNGLYDVIGLTNVAPESISMGDSTVLAASLKKLNDDLNALKAERLKITKEQIAVTQLPITQKAERDALTKKMATLMKKQDRARTVITLEIDRLTFANKAAQAELNQQIASLTVEQEKADLTKQMEKLAADLETAKAPLTKKLEDLAATQGTARKELLEEQEQLVANHAKANEELVARKKALADKLPPKGSKETPNEAAKLRREANVIVKQVAVIQALRDALDAYELHQSKDEKTRLKKFTSNMLDYTDFSPVNSKDIIALLATRHKIATRKLPPECTPTEYLKEGEGKKRKLPGAVAYGPFRNLNRVKTVPQARAEKPRLDQLTQFVAEDAQAFDQSTLWYTYTVATPKNKFFMTGDVQTIKGTSLYGLFGKDRTSLNKQIRDLGDTLGTDAAKMKKDELLGLKKEIRSLWAIDSLTPSEQERAVERVHSPKK